MDNRMDNNWAETRHPNVSRIGELLAKIHKQLFRAF